MKELVFLLLSTINIAALAVEEVKKNSLHENRLKKVTINGISPNSKSIEYETRLLNRESFSQLKGVAYLVSRNVFDKDETEEISSLYSLKNSDVFFWTGALYEYNCAKKCLIDKNLKIGSTDSEVKSIFGDGQDDKKENKLISRSFSIPPNYDTNLDFHYKNGKVSSMHYSTFVGRSCGGQQEGPPPIYSKELDAMSEEMWEHSERFAAIDCRIVGNSNQSFFRAVLRKHLPQTKKTTKKDASNRKEYKLLMPSYVTERASLETLTVNPENGQLSMKVSKDGNTYTIALDKFTPKKPDEDALSYLFFPGPFAEARFFYAKTGLMREQSKGTPPLNSPLVSPLSCTLYHSITEESVAILFPHVITGFNLNYLEN